MKSFIATGVALLGLSRSLVHGAAVPAESVSLIERSPDPIELEQRQTAACTNSPTNRGCWLPGFDINTDMYAKWPNTGRTVVVSSATRSIDPTLSTMQYDLSITNTTCNPDGHGARVCLLINNKLPGPLITANWGM